MVVNINIMVFRGLTECRLIGGCQCSGRSCYLHLQSTSSHSNNVFEKQAVSILAHKQSHSLRPEDGSSKFIWNIGTKLYSIKSWYTIILKTQQFSVMSNYSITHTICSEITNINEYSNPVHLATKVSKHFQPRALFWSFVYSCKFIKCIPSWRSPLQPKCTFLLKLHQHKGGKYDTWLETDPDKLEHIICRAIVNIL
jgi:hypothetical protein